MGSIGKFISNSPPPFQASVVHPSQPGPAASFPFPVLRKGHGRINYALDKLRTDHYPLENLKSLLRPRKVPDAAICLILPPHHSKARRQNCLNQEANG